MTFTGFTINPTPRLVSDEQIAKFSTFAVSNISDAMLRTTGTDHLRPFHRNGRLIGRALTVKSAPADNLMVHKAIRMAQPGDVIVVETGGHMRHAVIGELMSAAAGLKGVTGFVIDGAIRDSAVLAEKDFGVFARGISHRGPFREGPGEINVPISIDGMVTLPGDLIIGDHDGVIAIRPKDLDQIAEQVRAIEEKEKNLLQQMADGTLDSRWIDETLQKKGVVL